MKTLQIFSKKELEDRMNGIYKDFKFVKNEDENYISKREIPLFNNVNLDYSVGVYNRVITSIPKNIDTYDNKNELTKMILFSLFYLNPNMKENQLYNIFNKYSTIDYFPKNFNFYKNLYDRRLNIKREMCYKKEFKVIVNEIKMARNNNTNIHTIEFKNILVNWYKKNAKSVYEEWLSYEVGYYFYNNLNTYDISEEKIMDYFKIKDIRTVKKYLKFNRIKFNKDSVTYIDEITNEEVTTKLKDIRDYIIEKNINYFIKGNKKISIQLLLSECKYVNYNNTEHDISRTYLFDFFKKNKDLKEKIDNHNQNLGHEELIIREEKEEVILKPKKYKNKWGKVIEESFDDYKDIFE